MSSPAAHCRMTSTLCAALRLLFSRYSSEPKGADPWTIAGAWKRLQALSFSLPSWAAHSPISTGSCCCCFLCSRVERTPDAKASPNVKVGSHCTLFLALDWAHSWPMLVAGGSARGGLKRLLQILSLMTGLFCDGECLRSLALQASASARTCRKARLSASITVTVTRGEGVWLLLAPLHGTKGIPPTRSISRASQNRVSKVYARSLILPHPREVDSQVLVRAYKQRSVV